MARTEEEFDRQRDPEQKREHSNSKSINREASSEANDVDNGPNQVSNGTQSSPREPGIARVGNTRPDEDERH